MTSNHPDEGLNASGFGHPVDGQGHSRAGEQMRGQTGCALLLNPKSTTDQVDHRDQILRRSVPTCLTLGCLDQPV